jgi:hypothetical protein
VDRRRRVVSFILRIVALVGCVFLLLLLPLLLFPNWITCCRYAKCWMTCEEIKGEKMDGTGTHGKRDVLILIVGS